MGQFPLIPGHEFAGTVVEVGREVTDLVVGERVAVDPNLPCGHCVFCWGQQANHCLHWQGVGVTRGGGFAEYVSAPARACYRLPSELSDGAAAFVEPLACVVYALQRLRVHPADDVLIFGAGPMGLLLVQALRRSGAAQVVVVDRNPARLALATQLGAHAALLADEQQPDALRQIAPHGFPIVVDATGVPGVIEAAFGYLRPRGQYLQFGVTPMNAKVEISPYQIFRNDWTIIGSFALCYTFQEAIAWLQAGAIDVTPLISHTGSLAEFPNLFAQFAQGQTLKVQVMP